MNMKSTLSKAFRFALICGATFTSLTSANAGQWDTLVDGLKDISEESVKPLRQHCTDKLKEGNKIEKWKKRSEILDKVAEQPIATLDDAKILLTSKVGSFAPYIQPMKIVTQFLDGDSLYALASTNNKAAVKIVADELTVRFPSLVRQLQLLKEELKKDLDKQSMSINATHSGQLTFVDSISDYYNWEDNDQKILNGVHALFGYIKPMFRVAVSPNGNRDLGLQAAHFVMMAKELCTREPRFFNGQFAPFKKSIFGSRIIEIPAMAIGMGEVEPNKVEVCVFKANSIKILEDSFKNGLQQHNLKLRHNSFHVAIAKLNLDKDENTIQDIRNAADALCQIDYFTDFPNETAELVLSNLLKGPFKAKGDACGRGILWGAEVNRTLEEKVDDFKLMRKLYKHAKSLGFKLGGSSFCPTGSPSWTDFLPVLKIEKQAELFIERDLDRIFK